MKRQNRPLFKQIQVERHEGAEPERLMAFLVVSELF